jgi:hypothetical protein
MKTLFHENGQEPRAQGLNKINSSILYFPFHFSPFNFFSQVKDNHQLN